MFLDAGGVYNGFEITSGSDIGSLETKRDDSIYILNFKKLFARSLQK